MVATASTMIALGSKAPDFALPDTRDGTLFSFAKNQAEKGTVIMFLSNHCPYVKHVQKKLVELATIYQPQGIQFIAISANDIEKYPADSPENMRIEAETQHYPFPYLFDESQEIAQAYQATCTPDFFLFDKNLECVYRGRLDDSTPGNHKPVTGEDLQNALEALLVGKAIATEQKPSIGCNIKWKN